MALEDERAERKRLYGILLEAKATPEQLRNIEGALDKVPIGFIAALVRNDMHIVAIPPGGKFEDFSPTLRENGGQGSVPFAVAGMYVLSERTVYLRNTDEMTVTHEVGHAVDAALGGGDRYCSNNPVIKLDYDRATRFVTPYAAAGCDEWFAEAFRSHVGGNLNELSIWPRVSPERLKEIEPKIAQLFETETIRLGAIYKNELQREAQAVTKDAKAPNRPPKERGTKERGTKERSSDRGPARAEKQDFRTELTEQVIKMLEEGVAPWQRSWKSASISRPYNGIRGNEYHGGNRLWLTMRAMQRGYDDPRWMTFKQALARGMQVRAGEKATTVEYWDFKSAANTDPAAPASPDKGDEKATQLEEHRRRPKVFYAKVFNAAQIDAPVRNENGDPVLEDVDSRGVVITDDNRAEAIGEIKQQPKMAPLPEVQPVNDWKAKEFTPIERAERILLGSGATIEHSADNRPCYIPSLDKIQMPDPRAFKAPENYYSTLAHEIGHWSGHESRLKRDLSGAFGSESYAREELRAEMASMYLAAETGLPHDTASHAAYVDNWIQVLRKDKHELFRAAADAEKIADYVLDLDVEHKMEREQMLRERHEVAVDEPTIAAMPAALVTPRIAVALIDELPHVKQIIDRADFPDEIVGTIAGRDDDGRLLAHIGRGVAIAVDASACGPRVPSIGEKVRLTRVDGRERVADVKLEGMELAR